MASRTRPTHLSQLVLIPNVLATYFALSGRAPTLGMSSAVWSSASATVCVAEPLLKVRSPTVRDTIYMLSAPPSTRPHSHALSLVSCEVFAGGAGVLQSVCLNCREKSGRGEGEELVKEAEVEREEG